MHWKAGPLIFQLLPQWHLRCWFTYFPVNYSGKYYGFKNSENFLNFVSHILDPVVVVSNILPLEFQKFNSFHAFMQHATLYYVNMEGKKCSVNSSFIQIHISVNTFGLCTSTYLSLMQSNITSIAKHQINIPRYSTYTTQKQQRC